MSEEWHVDNLGFVTNGKQFFHKRDVDYVAIHTEDVLTFHVKNVTVNITIKDATSLNGLFKWFCELMRDSEERRNKHHADHHNYQDALLATQKQLLGTNIILEK